MKVDDMIRRLRDSQREDHRDFLRDSEDAGLGWAREDAKYHELKALANKRDAEEGLDFSKWTGPCVWSPGELFYFYIVPENEGDRDKAQEFWQKINANPSGRINVNPGSADSVSAFAESALNQWDGVKGPVSLC